MGTIAIQTQCCLQERDDRETDEEEGSQEEKVQLVEPVPWHGRSGGGPAGAPPRTGRGAQEPLGRKHHHSHGQRVGPFRCT